MDICCHSAGQYVNLQWSRECGHDQNYAAAEINYSAELTLNQRHGMYYRLHVRV